MLLCDIGNSNSSFLDQDKFFSLRIDDFINYKSNEKVFFINVNEKLKEHIKTKTNFINLEPFFRFDTAYKGLGVDRIAACYTIKDGIVVDAGSAITVDVVCDSIHLGGFILPGFASYQKAYGEISPRLQHELNTQIDLEVFPQKTNDALSYGVFKSIILLIENIACGKKIFFTGGDGQFLSKFFTNSIYDKLLVFRGMRKVIEENPQLLH